MLRKHTSFFDPTLNFLGDDTVPFENARTFRNRIAELIESISIIPVNEDSKRSTHFDWLKEKSAGCFKGMHFSVVLGTETIREIEEVCQRVYRLESTFRYPWEDEPEDGDVCRREMILTIDFFEKNARRPFFRVKLKFDIDGWVFVRYWDKVS